MATTSENNTIPENDSNTTNNSNESKSDCLNEFVRIGRTGRRNAVADLSLGM